MRQGSDRAALDCWPDSPTSRIDASCLPRRIIVSLGEQPVRSNTSPDSLLEPADPARACSADDAWTQTSNGGKTFGQRGTLPALDPSDLLPASASAEGTSRARTPSCLHATANDPGGTIKSYLYNGAGDLCWSAPATMPATPNCGSPPTGATTYGYDPASGFLTSSATGGISTTYDTTSSPSVRKPAK